MLRDGGSATAAVAAAAAAASVIDMISEGIHRGKWGLTSQTSNKGREDAPAGIKMDWPASSRQCPRNRCRCAEARQKDLVTLYHTRTRVDSIVYKGYDVVQWHTSTTVFKPARAHHPYNIYNKRPAESPLSLVIRRPLMSCFGPVYTHMGSPLPQGDPISPPQVGDPMPSRARYRRRMFRAAEMSRSAS